MVAATYPHAAFGRLFLLMLLLLVFILKEKNYLKTCGGIEEVVISSYLIRSHHLSSRMSSSSFCNSLRATGSLKTGATRTKKLMR